MRKVLVVAVREYLAAVRTKTFVLGLLVMPVLMGGSLVLQHLLEGMVDTQTRHYAVIDRTPGQKLAGVVEKGVSRYNAETIWAGDTQVKPKFLLHVVEPSTADPKATDQQRYQLSERVRRGKLAGFLEILGGDPYSFPPPGKAEELPHLALRYQTNRATDVEFAKLADEAVTKRVRAVLGDRKGLRPAEVQVLVVPAVLQQKGLSVRDEATGEVHEASEHSRLASLVAPMALMMLMFVVVLMSATPLMQGVVEEKMQRIAEVLLGSVAPFPLMLGKLIGMTAVSLTISAVYLAGAYGLGMQFGMVEYIGVELVVWFVVYQTLAALMFGSLFIAVGAACTDMKETQNLLWPVMLLAALPVFLLGNVLREPNSPVVVGLSFFPFATPMLMITRMGVPPGIPWWQPVLGVVPVLLTTVFCVWAAGRIFRVGILMQGKGARIGEMVKWVFRG